MLHDAKTLSEPRLLAHWSFDAGGAGPSLDQAGGVVDRLHGHLAIVKGVHRFALRLDGFTTFLERPAGAPLALTRGVAIDAWVALGAYPWNLAPIVDLGGVLLGVDDRGALVLRVEAAEGPVELRSAEPLGLGRWRHVAGAYDPQRGATLTIDGAAAGEAAARGGLPAGLGVSILIGRSRAPLAATGGIRPASHLPIPNYLDAVLDEVRVHDGPLPPAAVARALATGAAGPAPALPERRLPVGAGGRGRFGAFYTHLSYFDAWDRRWRVGAHPDVVVRFEDEDYRFVFWRGTNYIPCWATGEGIWYTNEFNETWGHGATGCAEPMSDKHCAFSHVRILETSAARAVIHWRYALVDVTGTRPRKDPVTGWTDWSDEVYVIYPDGTGTRTITLHSSQPLDPHEFQETIVVLSPGQRPEDVIEPEALTMANMAGEEHVYSWVGGCPAVIDRPDRANIQRIGVKSPTKPFVVVSDGHCLKRDLTRSDRPVFPVYREEIRPPQLFPWWNHWPTAELPSDGRYAQAADRAAHSSLLTGMEWEDYEVTPTSRTRVMLHGLTRLAAGDLAPLARSWLRPPALRPVSAGLRSEGYDQRERAYRLRLEPGAETPLRLTLDATPGAPLVNVALLVADWAGDADLQPTVDGAALAQADVRIALHPGLSGDTLVVWLRLSREAATEIVLGARAAPRPKPARG
jgi:hypothetical protein